MTGLAQVKSEGMCSNYDNQSIQPWNGYREEFSEWFEHRYTFCFGTKWLKPIAKKYASNAWDSALLINAKLKMED